MGRRELVCTRKRSYRSLPDAEAACIRLYLGTGKEGLGVYICPFCSKYHVGTLVTNKYARFELDRALGKKTRK